MEIRTQLNQKEHELLLELGKGILADGLRVALGIVEGTKLLHPDLYTHSINQAQTLRDAYKRDRARLARRQQLSA